MWVLLLGMARRFTTKVYLFVASFDGQFLLIIRVALVFGVTITLWKALPFLSSVSPKTISITKTCDGNTWWSNNKLLWDMRRDSDYPISRFMILETFSFLVPHFVLMILLHYLLRKYYFCAVLCTNVLVSLN